jgi:predicted heme/steroid binding protein
MSAAEPPRRFTARELAAYDGSRGRAYVAYRSKVYDVSTSAEWRSGLHRALHWAGQDLTAELADAPHGEENLAPYPVVGILDAAPPAEQRSDA